MDVRIISRISLRNFLTELSLLAQLTPNPHLGHFKRKYNILCLLLNVTVL